MKCKLCPRHALTENGWFNIAAFIIPLCFIHMAEYKRFKEDFYEKV